MMINRLTLYLMSFAFCNGSVMGATDCTLPWLADKNIYIRKIKSLTINRCPHILENGENKYCCYNYNEEVECCDLQHFLIFILTCLIQICIILFVLYCICYYICCIFCPNCAVYKRRNVDRSPAVTFHQYPRQL